jgi:hypothetical protein
MVVGKDIMIVYPSNFLGKMLVGLFCGKAIKEETLSKWLELNQFLVLGYMPRFHILVRG